MAHIQCGRNVLRRLIKDSTLNSSDSITHPLLFGGQGLRYRKLEVILTTSIEKLGKAGETVKVAPGYFRNHLMPKLLAVPNIEKYAYLIREQRKLHQPEEVETVKVVPLTKEDKMKEYLTAAKRLDNARLVLRRLIRVNKDTDSTVHQLQSPVNKDELVAEVARQLCVSIQPENLYLPEPLSSMGTFEVPLLLPRSIPLPEGKLRWTLDVKVRSK
ncbi:Ribosomal protein L9 [Macleaya cordata]|uniref:Large ribosomal subunit protein bL9c n=1 Tax=Macleaya cordata TaxID=56857 RepID=A0A200QN32_MACCD|nr:Ribosomal protein L9 [Macleaya cordata]